MSLSDYSKEMKKLFWQLHQFKCAVITGGVEDCFIVGSNNENLINTRQCRNNEKSL